MRTKSGARITGAEKCRNIIDSGPLSTQDMRIRRVTDVARKSFDLRVDEFTYDTHSCHVVVVAGEMC